MRNSSNNRTERECSRKVKTSKFLKNYSDLHEPSYRSGPVEIFKDRRLGSRSLLSGYTLHRLDDAEVYRHYRICWKAVEKLRAQRWSLFERLIPVYFSSDSAPYLVDQWRERAVADNAACLALIDHEVAIRFMYEHVQSRLGEDERLLIVTPGALIERSRRARRRPTCRQVKALELFYAYLESLNRPEAIRRAARASGYSEGSVRNIVRQAEQE